MFVREAVFRQTHRRAQTDIQLHKTRPFIRPSIPLNPKGGKNASIRIFTIFGVGQSFDPMFTLAGNSLLISVVVRLFLLCRNTPLWVWPTFFSFP